MPRIVPPGAGKHLAFRIKLDVQRPIEARVCINPYNSPADSGKIAKAVPYLCNPPGFHLGDLAPVVYTAIKIESDRQIPLLLSGWCFYLKSWQLESMNRSFAGHDGPIRMIFFD